MRFAIFGLGGFGREIAPLAQELAVAGGAWPSAEGSPAVIFVDDAQGCPEACNGIPVIGFDALCSDEHRDRAVIVAVGDGRTREAIEQRCEAAGLTIGTLSAATARVLANNEIRPGTVLCDFTMVTSNAVIGKSFQSNIYSYVAHDCVIGDYVTFAPRVCCNGNVHIGDYAYIGTGALFIQGKNDKPLVIGEGAIVGMGSVVTKPVEPYTLVAGVPAKMIRRLPRPDLPEV